MKKTNREIKSWAVIWEAESAKEYGYKPNGILVVGPDEDDKFKVKCKCHKQGWHWGYSLAIFDEKKSAIAFVGGNKDWRVIPCKIIFETPSLIKKGGEK